ncbi:hypothetical protein QE152_g8954 [Popillia japonica]|uniref:Uncharacterized protein n=1 Tax=Popillia japonica TaxID=7064 RepID=A0AAW1M1R6_POPJA
MKTYLVESCVDISPGDLFATWISTKKGDKIVAVAEKCCLILGLTDPPENIQDELTLPSKFYCLKIKSRWDKSARKQSTFLTTNKAWLGKQISLPDIVKSFNSNI